ncbi:MAG: Gfo/Idh/MocA family oxidoreductase [Pirellulales bacterium]
MTQAIRLAFIGIDHPHGAHWRATLENLRERAVISAIVPAYDGGLTSLEERFAEVPRFATVEELIAHGDFEAAVVCLPNNAGAAALVKLIEAGKHVLTEKPVGATAADLDPVVAACARHRVAFQNGFMWRYDTGANRLRDMVREGRFGKLASVEMTFVTSDVRRRGPDHYLFDAAVSGGGFLNWLGCHYLDLLPYVTGQRIVGVTARLGVFGATPMQVEDGGTVLLDLSGGGLATFTGGYWLPRWAGESGWAIRGTERWVHWHPTRPQTSGVLEIHGPQPQWHAMEETFTIAADNTPGYGGLRGVSLVADWLDAVRSGKPCRNTPESTRATLQILDAAYESSRSDRRVTCDIG